MYKRFISKPQLIAGIKGFFVGTIITAISFFVVIKFFYSPQITDSKNAIMENGFCYYQPLPKKYITYNSLNEQSFSQQCDGQSRVDIGAFQDEDVQKKVILSVYNDVKNIKPKKPNSKDIWVTSDIHGDIKMLLQGLLKSGIVTWDGSLKKEKYIAYKGKILTVIYPDVAVNKAFKGVYINLGDVVNKNAFGISSLYLLHDIYEKTKNKNGSNTKVKIIVGNHEYHDLLPTTISAYKETLMNFIDMFDVYYEKDGLSFSHAPITQNLKPKNKKEIRYLKSLLSKDDENFKLKHLLYGYEGLGAFLNSVKPGDPDKILSKSVSGHTHGPVDLGYNTRKDVLNTANDRFSKKISQRGIIFRINTGKKSVYSYTSNDGIELIEGKIDKNLFD